MAKPSSFVYNIYSAVGDFHIAYQYY